MSEKQQCVSCESNNITFHGYRGLNLMYRCEECGLLFIENDKKEQFSTMGVR